ncbi:MAG TPA: hypothetical protein VN811_15600 [Thermoanaerobaculia bacterium]|nr:hypothetical protein [Thermoanaerobaculia bacterium]
MVATWSVPVLRLLTKIVGIVLIVLGIVGVVVGTEPLLGLVNLDTVENVIHLITGGLLLWAGFAREPVLRKVVGTLGVLSLGAGILGFIAPNLFGLVPHGYSHCDNLLHLTLGILGVFFAWIVRGPRAQDVAGA